VDHLFKRYFILPVLTVLLVLMISFSAYASGCSDCAKPQIGIEVGTAPYLPAQTGKNNRIMTTTVSNEPSGDGSITLTNINKYTDNANSSISDVDLDNPEMYTNDTRLYFKTAPIVAKGISGESWHIELEIPGNPIIKWKPVYWYSEYDGKKSVFVNDGEIWDENTTSLSWIIWWFGIQCYRAGEWKVNVYHNNDIVAYRTITVHPGIDPQFIVDGELFRQGHYPNDYIGTKTIAKVGCALTSCSIMLNYYGIKVTPDQLNTWLKGKGGYTGNLINWSVVAAYARSKGVNLRAGTKINNRSMVEQYLCRYGPQIMNTKNGNHWVCVYGQNDQKDDWYTSDPAFGTKGLLSTRRSPYNNWQCVKLFSADWFPNDGKPHMFVTLGSPAELVIIDSQGRRTGFDPRTGVSYNEIPGVILDYEIVADEETGEIHTYKILDIEDSTQKYDVQVIGTGVGGLYNLWVNAEEYALKEIQSTIAPNMVHTYEIQYDGNTEKFEAEQMNLLNYTVEAEASASGGNLIKTNSGTGSADFLYSGISGTKNMTIWYYDQNNGSATYKLYINDVLKDTWTADKDLGASWFTASTRTFRYLSDIAINTGDRIKIEGTVDGSENAAVDFVEISAPATSILEKATSPIFSLTEGTYNSPQSLVISCNTDAAVIRYTVDRTIPNISSPVYSGPIAVNANMTVKAYASKSGFNDSNVVTATYTITNPSNQVTAPTFIPIPGNYISQQSVEIACATEGATIRYTTDGSMPNVTSPVYSSPIAVTQATTIKAYASKNGISDSEIKVATYTFKIPAPTFDPVEGIYDSPQSVFINYALEGATIHYTTDGSTPNVASPIYTGPITIDKYTIIKAYATINGVDSEVTTATYSIQVQTPIFDPQGGEYDKPLVITINCDTTDATIRYTIDGSTPNIASPVYTNPISISQTTTIKAYATKAGFNDSAMATETYRLRVNQPTLSLASGTYYSSLNVILSCSTNGAIIRYTIDGSTPNASSPVYTGPVTIDRTTALEAYASFTGMEDSALAYASYKIKVRAPIFSPDSGTFQVGQQVTMSCPTEGATIRYTIDGNNPDASSPIYDGPISLAKDVTIKAFATKEPMDPSDVTTAVYNNANLALGHSATAYGTISWSNANYAFDGDMTTRWETYSSTKPFWIYVDLGSVKTINNIKLWWLSYYAKSYQIQISNDAGSWTDVYSTTAGDGGLDNISFPSVDARYVRMYATQPKENGFSYILCEFEICNYQVVPTPVFTPAAGAYTTFQNVIISCPMGGAAIHYTLDGSAPDAASPVYTEPIVVSNATVKAYATMDGLPDSNVATAVYSITSSPDNVINGDFEDGPGVGWTEYAFFKNKIIGKNMAHNGIYSAQMGEKNYIEQQIKIPVNGVLTYWWYMTTTELEPRVFLYIDLYKTDGTYLANLQTKAVNQFNLPTSWAKDRISLVDYAGQTVKLRFSSRIDNIVNLWIDDIVIGQPVATPTLSPPPGNYSSVQTVMINCETEGATIHYTTDGSSPRVDSPVYFGPITVANSMTIKAYATKKGYADSAVVTAIYAIPSISNLLINPDFESGPGFGWNVNTADGHESIDTTLPQTGSYSLHLGGYDNANDYAEQQVIIPPDGVLTYLWYMTSNEDAEEPFPLDGLFVDLYTTDGTFLTTLTSYSNVSERNIWMPESIRLTSYAGQSVILRFQCGTNNLNSTTFWIDNVSIHSQAAVPTFSPAAGDYDSAQTVTISCESKGATIRYTIDGSIPNAQSPIYTAPIRVTNTLSNSVVINAYATKVGIKDSDIATATYNFKVKNPSFNPVSGIYTSAQDVTFSCATNGAIIRYTTDGSTPSASSPVYSGPITVANTMRIKAYATKEGFMDSAVVTGIYIIGSTSTQTSLINPGFESGPGVGWTKYAADGHELIDTALPQTGSYSLHLGGYDNADDYAEQQVTIPANGVLTYWWHMTSNESEECEYPSDFLYVILVNTDGDFLAELRIHNNLSERNAWVPEIVDLDSYAGQTVKLLFGCWTNETLSTAFWIDNVAITK
jgi:hypothetical protein